MTKDWSSGWDTSKASQKPFGFSLTKNWFKEGSKKFYLITLGNKRSEPIVMEKVPVNMKKKKKKTRLELWHCCP